MNSVEPPYVIVVRGTASLDKAILDHLEAATSFLAEVREEVRTKWDRDVDARSEILPFGPS